jgi:uncharacterized LabA/DUF88 family protein
VAEEVALFVDLENIATSMWNTYQQAPDPLKWVEKVRQYGLMGFARAYGDFSQPFMQRLAPRIRVAGIEVFDCPVKRREDRTQSTVDVNVAIDLYEVALDRPGTETFILMAGDRDYVRIVARLRHRLGKRIVIAGVPGSVSRDLVEAAGEEDPLEPVRFELDEMGEQELIRVINRYEMSRKPGVFPIFRFMADFIRHPTNAHLIDPNVVDGKLNEFLERGILIQEMRYLEDGRAVRLTRLNRDDASVIEAIGYFDDEPDEEDE